jgi:hypothetical protein
MKNRKPLGKSVRSGIRLGPYVFALPSILFLFLFLVLGSLILLLLASDADARPPLDKADWQKIYDPGIPPSLSVEWSYPSGFSLGIDSGYRLRIGDGNPDSRGQAAKVNTIPLSFMMRYSLYESPRISQSVGFGLGPYFFHQGRMPIQLQDVDVTGSTTCVTEWISYISRDLYINLKMRYTQAFQFVVDDIPLWDFTTWMGMNLRW